MIPRNYILYSLVTFMVLLSCSKKEKVTPTITLSERILGTWEWEYSWRTNDTVIYDSSIVVYSRDYTFKENDTVVIVSKHTSGTYTFVTTYSVGKGTDYWTREEFDALTLYNVPADPVVEHSQYKLSISGPVMTLFLALPPGHFYENYRKKE